MLQSVEIVRLITGDITTNQPASLSVELAAGQSLCPIEPGTSDHPPACSTLGWGDYSSAVQT